MWPFSSKKPIELLNDLEHPDHTVQQKAFKALLEHTDPSTNEDIITKLRFFDNLTNNVQIALIELVGKRAIIEAVPLLQNILKNSNININIKLVTLRALKNFFTPQVIDIFIHFLAYNDPQIRKEAKEYLLQISPEELLGSLLKNIPSDQTSNLYFEISLLMEELGLYEKIVENFYIPDLNLKLYWFNNMIKLHRPEFIKLYLELANQTQSEPQIQEKIKNALLEYTLDELIDKIKFILNDRNTKKNTLEIIYEVLTKKALTNLDIIFKILESVVIPEVKLFFVSKLCQILDPFLFIPAFELLNDPLPRIRSLISDYLFRLADKLILDLSNSSIDSHEEYHKLLQSWLNRITDAILGVEFSNSYNEIVRLLFHLSTQTSNYDSIEIVITRILEENFTESINNILLLPFDIQSRLVKEAVRKMPSLAASFVSGLGKNNSNNYLRLVIKIFSEIPEGDKRVFIKNLEARIRNTRILELIEDKDDEIRKNILIILVAIGDVNLNKYLEKLVFDNNPIIRMEAIKTCKNFNYPNLKNILIETLKDPEPEVVLLALRFLKEITPIDEYKIYLSKLAYVNNEQIKNFVLTEIAKIAKKNFVQNYKLLPPEVRKLAGSAISKIDTSFIDEVISDLNSLDPETRLKAAMIIENIQITTKVKEALINAMKDPSKKVRAAVAKTLGVINDKSVMRYLIELLNDPDERVRANTIEALASFGDETIIKILLPYLDDPNNRIRANSALALWKIGKLDVIPVINKMLSSGNSLMIASALWVLGEIKQDAHLNLIIPFLADSNILVKSNAIKAVAKIKPEVLKSYLPTLRLDPNPEIKKLLIELSYKIT